MQTRIPAPTARGRGRAPLEVAMRGGVTRQTLPTLPTLPVRLTTRPRVEEE